MLDGILVVVHRQLTLLFQFGDVLPGFQKPL